MLNYVKPQIEEDIKMKTQELTERLKYLEEYQPRQITFSTDSWNTEYSEIPDWDRNSKEPITLRLSRFDPHDHTPLKKTLASSERTHLTKSQKIRLNQYEKRLHLQLKDEFPDFRDPTNSDFFDYNDKKRDKVDNFIKTMI